MCRSRYLNCAPPPLILFKSHLISSVCTAPAIKCHHFMTCHNYQIDDFNSILMGESLQTFEHMFSTTHCSVLNGGAFVNNEHIDVYIVSLPEIIPLQDFVLQESEVMHPSRARLFVV